MSQECVCRAWLSNDNYSNLDNAYLLEAGKDYFIITQSVLIFVPFRRREYFCKEYRY